MSTSMPTEVREVAPGSHPRSVVTDEGLTLRAPEHWVLVRPGDAALSRRIKKAGPYWLVSEKKGKKTFSRGMWADKEVVQRLQNELIQERSQPGYQKKLDAARAKRVKKQALYAEDFEAHVVRFLNFNERHQALGYQLARVISVHAVPVGSGTVARTERIPIEKRAEAATIAWMRHQTTSYDDLKIPRVKGLRREVRRMLAARSVQLLLKYRSGQAIDANCPLRKALKWNPEND